MNEWQNNTVCEYSLFCMKDTEPALMVCILLDAYEYVRYINMACRLLRQIHCTSRNMEY